MTTSQDRNRWTALADAMEANPRLYAAFPSHQSLAERIAFYRSLAASENAWDYPEKLEMLCRFVNQEFERVVLEREYPGVHELLCEVLGQDYQPTPPPRNI